ncbi:hypothetical protein CHS0354_022247 [Potamilus streckersoni]|uniref:Cytochrome c oxidase subunit n=1 Tax=Potamilus streckersoni TaxID=2493646 RepID=A0AAE0TFK4_9BIVA|nr:hypothetical protein CHS0354_022247 [Potamilus streckersoni]
MASRFGAFTLGLRRYATAAVGGAHHESSMKRWKYLTFFVALPGISLCYYNAFIVGEEHSRPDFIEYEYLRRRTKPFPWGDGNHTLFHNPQTNALPGIGYEEELEHRHH